MSHHSHFSHSRKHKMSMERQELSKTLLCAKKSQNLTWEEIGQKLSCSPIWIASVVHGQNAMTNEKQASDLCELLGVSEIAKDDFVKELMIPPVKMQKDLEMLKQDPTIYRLHEVMLIYGESIKELINEQFGAGIMSAVDVKIDFEKEVDPHGDRVKLIISGKYLKFREW